MTLEDKKNDWKSLVYWNVKKVKQEDLARMTAQKL